MLSSKGCQSTGLELGITLTSLKLCRHGSGKFWSGIPKNIKVPSTHPPPLIRLIFNTYWHQKLQEPSPPGCRALASTFVSAQETSIEAAFKTYDLDGSGYLSPGELCAAIKVDNEFCIQRIENLVGKRKKERPQSEIRKNHVGSANTLYNKRKGTLAPGAHAAPGHRGHNVCSCFQWHVRLWSIPQLIQGMGSIDNPTHIQEDCVESHLGILKLLARFTVLSL
eukprot:522803-Pelagomonas_calceolata.AAC.4